jgi:hypothetical protein
MSAEQLIFSAELMEHREKVEQECRKLQALIDNEIPKHHSCGVPIVITSA